MRKEGRRRRIDPHLIRSDCADLLSNMIYVAANAVLTHSNDFVN